MGTQSQYTFLSVLTTKLCAFPSATISQDVQTLDQKCRWPSIDCRSYTFSSSEELCFCPRYPATIQLGGSFECRQLVYGGGIGYLGDGGGILSGADAATGAAGIQR